MSFEAVNAIRALHQRVDARARLSVRRSAGRTRIARLFQEGAAKIRMPHPEDDSLQAVLINTAGGLTGGDRIAWAFDVEEGASAVVTTQACERIYRSSGGEARAAVSVTVGEGASFGWLPQETIVFDGSAFARSIDADLAPGARGLFVEATIFGRRAMGEVVSRALFSDRWRIHRAGRLVHAENFAIGPDVAGLLAAPAIGNGAGAVATILLLHDDCEMLLPAVRGIVGDAGGASVWRVGETGKLLARIAAEDGYGLRRQLVPLVSLLNGQAGLPKVWSL